MYIPMSFYDTPCRVVVAELLNQSRISVIKKKYTRCEHVIVFRSKVCNILNVDFSKSIPVRLMLEFNDFT